MSEMKRCAACGKENPVSEMKVCMHHQMHRYVCDSKCMTDFYNAPKKPTAAELAAKVEELEAELAQLRAGQEPAGYFCEPFGNGKFEQVDPACAGDTDVFPLYTAPQPSAVPVVHGIDADDVRAACQNAVEVFAEVQHAELCREVAEYMREVLLADLDRAAPATVQGARWIPVSQQLPKQNEKVLVTYTNQLGNCRRVIAELVAKHTVEASDDCFGDGADYDEATDQYYCPAGWYECVGNWDELAYLAIHEGEVTHWMPLPASPAIAAAQEGGKV